MFQFDNKVCGDMVHGLGRYDMDNGSMDGCY